MNTFLNYINRCWLLFIIGGVFLYEMIDSSAIDLQYLNTYKYVAPALIDCVPSMCTQDTLKKGLFYYTHWAHLFKDSMEANNAAGYCFYHLKEYRHALKYLNRSIELEPQNPTLYFNQALDLLNLGEYSKGLASLKKGSAFLSTSILLRPNIIFPNKKNPNLDAPSQAEFNYYSTLLGFKELISLSHEIVNTVDVNQKKVLKVKIQDKINALDLFYYVPVYHLSAQGKDIIMI